MRFYVVYRGQDHLDHYLADTATRAAYLWAVDNRGDTGSVGARAVEETPELQAAADRRRWLEGRLDVEEKSESAL